MITKLADIIADWLIDCNVIKDVDKELYSYAVYSMLFLLSPLMLAVGFGACMGCVDRSVLIVIPFMFIRKFSGGYHTKHTWSCLMWSSLLLFLCVVLSFNIKCGWILAFLTIGAAVSLICNSPIDNENRSLSCEEHIRYKGMTTVLVIIFLFINILFFMCHLQMYSVCVSIGIMLSAGLQLPCIFRGFMKMLK